MPWQKDTVFLERQALLAPFGLTRFATDGWGASERHIAPQQHEVGKEHTPKIERKHSNLQTRMKRLVRRTICFVKTTTRHDLVLGLCINRYELSRSKHWSPNSFTENGVWLALTSLVVTIVR